MSKAIVVHGFETSNNFKVRVALGYKGLDYEFRTIDPSDRETIVKLSGQHLTPVLEHDGRVLCDSAAILRYLDLNFPDTPKLLGTSLAEQWEIEDWEMFTRTKLAGPMLAIVHRRVTGQEVEEELVARCADDFDHAAQELGAQLGEREWLVGDAMSVADVSAGAILARVCAAKPFELRGSVDALRSYQDRVMQYDAGA